MKIDLKQWHKIFNRPLTLQQAQTYSFSCAKNLEKIIGRGINNTLYIIRENSADGYFLDTEWKKFNNYFLHHQFLNKYFLKNINQKVIRGSLFIEAYFTKIAKQNLHSVSNRQLLKIFKDTIKILNTKIGYLWVGFILSNITEQKLIEVLTRNHIPTTKGLKIISALEQPHHIIQEQLDLMKIAVQPDNKEKKLINHYHKYLYIPCYSSIVEPYPLKYFRNRLNKLSPQSAKNFIKKTKLSFKRNKITYENLIKNNTWTELDRLFIDYAHHHFFLKDYRSHFRSLAMFQHGRILQEIAYRYNLSSQDVSSLLFTETLKLFMDPTKIKKLISERKKSNQIYQFKNGQDKILNQKNILETKKTITPDILYGQPANPGIIIGTVKIIMNPNEIHKIKKGDILVATMTRPDYIVAMKKAGAIITDEGGLLCHAAIVAREMGKPCIIGTQKATQILKNGDLIKVDANQGIINKLN